MEQIAAMDCPLEALYAKVAVAEAMLAECNAQAQDLRIQITKMHREIVKLESTYYE